MLIIIAFFVNLSWEWISFELFLSDRCFFFGQWKNSLSTLCTLVILLFRLRSLFFAWRSTFISPLTLGPIHIFSHYIDSVEFFSVAISFFVSTCHFCFYKGKVTFKIFLSHNSLQMHTKMCPFKEFCLAVGQHSRRIEIECTKLAGKFKKN